MDTSASGYPTITVGGAVAANSHEIMFYSWDYKKIELKIFFCFTKLMVGLNFQKIKMKIFLI